MCVDMFFYMFGGMFVGFLMFGWTYVCVFFYVWLDVCELYVRVSVCFSRTFDYVCVVTFSLFFLFVEKIISPSFRSSK